MTPWHFVIAAYAIGLGGTGLLLLGAWQSMRSAEAHADSLKRHP